MPSWVRKGYIVSVNGAAQRLDAKPGTYVDAQPDSGARAIEIEIAMPFTFRAERTIDNPAVQSIFYGPTLLAVQHDAVGQNLETGLIKLSFYQHVKLDGDLAPAMTPGQAPLHFTTGGYTLAPFFVADPSADAESRTTAPYHMYVRRDEPQIVFRSIDSGVANRAREDGQTFLDELWSAAPFASHREFMTAVNRIAAAWQQSGKFSAAERSAIVATADKAAREI